MDLQQYILRYGLLNAVRQGLSEVPVVALLGARQVGKTTLAQEVASNWPGATTVFDLEVAAVREALSHTPETTLREQEGLVVIDEVQRLPALFETLRPICDDRSRRAVYLLLGSASWDLIKGVSETLAGRVQFDVGGLALAVAGTEHQDLGLHHICVIYPGDLAYALAKNISALPLKQIGTTSLAFGR